MAEPAPSATVVLARERDDVPEYLLVQRRAHGAFGSSHVFPGGMVDAQDRAVHERCSGRSAGDADECLGLRADALDYYSAAVRELFEETGVLLARDPSGRLPSASSADDAGPFAAERRKLLSGELSWPAFLGRHGLMLALERLTYFAWWVTPSARRRRFSTRFFLATLPAGQAARHDGRELTDSCWMRAADALAAGDRGELRLPPPTIATLRDLSPLARLDELRAWADQRAAAGVRRILPVIEIRGDRERIIMPGEPDYPAPGEER